MDMLSNILPSDILSIETWLKRVNYFYLFAIALVVVLSFIQYLLSSQLDAKRKIQLMGLESEVIKSKQDLEKEKIKRLELENAVSPRLMEQLKSSNNLKPFKGIKAIIKSIPDIEAKRTAGQIAATLNMAGWDIEFAPYNPKDIFQDGVIVERAVGARPENDISGPASDMLITQLQDNNIESHTMPASELPINTIIVKVGFKPYKYFTDKKVEEIKKDSTSKE
jgi:soluble cytochrome b562